MLVYRAIAKKVFWEFDSTIMQNFSVILPLFCTPTWPSHHVSENQELSLFPGYSLLAQSHNTPLLTPKILHNHSLQVLLGHEDLLREIKNNSYANFWGVKEVYYGICVSSE